MNQITSQSQSGKEFGDRNENVIASAFFVTYYQDNRETTDQGSLHEL